MTAGARLQQRHVFPEEDCLLTRTLPGKSVPKMKTSKKHTVLPCNEITEFFYTFEIPYNLGHKNRTLSQIFNVCFFLQRTETTLEGSYGGRMLCYLFWPLAKQFWLSLWLRLQRQDHKALSV